MEAGKSVYQDISARSHHGVSDEAPFEADCLEGIANTKLLALAALFKFHKRRHSFLRESLPSPASTPPSVSPAGKSPERDSSGGGGGGGGGGGPGDGGGGGGSSSS